MEKERLQEYAARVTQANRSELVVIIYEATLASIEEGKNYLKQGEIEAARHEIERARSMITELMGSLDLQYEISHYLFLQKCSINICWRYFKSSWTWVIERFHCFYIDHFIQ